MTKFTLIPSATTIKAFMFRPTQYANSPIPQMVALPNKLCITDTTSFKLQSRWETVPLLISDMGKKTVSVIAH